MTLVTLVTLYFHLKYNNECVVCVFISFLNNTKSVISVIASSPPAPPSWYGFLPWAAAAVRGTGVAAQNWFLVLWVLLPWGLEGRRVHQGCWLDRSFLGPFGYLVYVEFQYTGGLGFEQG